MKISVVIPTLNEEKKLGPLLEYLLRNSGDQTEVIVTDGGSTDDTLRIARAYGIRVAESQPGRAVQMNTGARVAKHDILYFLHVDTWPPETYKDDIRDAIRSGYGAGCYRLAFDNAHPLLTCYSWFTRFDLDVFRYGDQSLFVEKAVFEEIGGFREELKVMEDQVIIKDLKKITNFRIVKKNVITSARKYEQVGMLRLQLIFTIIVVMFYTGVGQDKIVAFYRDQLHRAMLR